MIINSKLACTTRKAYNVPHHHLKEHSPRYIHSVDSFFRNLSSVCHFQHVILAASRTSALFCTWFVPRISKSICGTMCAGSFGAIGRCPMLNPRFFKVGGGPWPLSSGHRIIQWFLRTNSCTVQYSANSFHVHT